MAKKKWTPEWEEIGRKPLGLHMSTGGKYEYANVVYEVTERSLKDKDVYRTRVDNGDPIYLHERPDIFEIFYMTSMGYNRLMHEGKKLDEKHLTPTKT